MSHALVVVESMFGNTEAVGRAVAEGLSVTMEVKVVHAGEAPSEIDEGIDLLVVGGPTHAFGMSRASTRKAASDKGAHPADGTDTGIRDWLKALAPAKESTLVAAFDTRIKKRGIPGSAAHGAEKALRRNGFMTAAPAESFYVSDTPGPMLPGELDRAREWGAALAHQCDVRQGRVTT